MSELEKKDAAIAELVEALREAERDLLGLASDAERSGFASTAYGIGIMAGKVSTVLAKHER